MVILEWDPVVSPLLPTPAREEPAMPIFTLDPESRVRKAVAHDGQVLRQTKKVLSPDGSVTWVEKSASPRYSVVDPVETAAKLDAAGFETRLLRFRSPWKTALSIRLPGEILAQPLNGRVESYAREVGFLLTNKGDAAILGQGTAVRIACRNAFPNPALRIRHTSDDALRFRDDPASFVSDLIRFADIARDRIDGLRGRPGGWNLVGWVTDSLRQAAEAARKAREAKTGRKARPRSPRLEKALLRAWEQYRREDGPSVWSAFQALTETRSPRLVGYVGKVFSDDDAYRSALDGDVPVGINLN